MENLLEQFFALCFYVLFMGFAFCDGFKLHIVRKLIWFALFLFMALLVFKTTSEFKLEFILPFPTLVALILCWDQNRIRSKK